MSLMEHNVHIHITLVGAMAQFSYVSGKRNIRGFRSVGNRILV